MRPAQTPRRPVQRGNIVRINRAFILINYTAPMPEVAGRPFVEHGIAHLTRFGVRDIALVSAQPGTLQRYHGARLFGAALSVSDFGGFDAAAGPPDELRFVTSSEIFFDADLLPLIGAASKAPGTGAALFHQARGGLSKPDSALIHLARSPGFADKRTAQAIVAQLDGAPGLSRVNADGYVADVRTPQGLSAARAELAQRRTRPAAFLDRDGTINIDRGWTHRAEDLVWVKDAAAAVRLLNQAGYYVFVVTNQGGVARGFYEETAVERLHDHMQAELMAQGAHIDAFYHCPHHPEGVVKAFAIECLCRKPGVGMLEQASRDWPVDRARSFMIGDRDGDMEAAAAFNIRGARFDLETQSLPEIVAREIEAGA